jgi:NAD(P)-dependent dehydrogenase (short-subunit alcohol dehydrogenase family)
VNVPSESGQLVPDFTGSKAVVVGASRGIGRAIAVALARGGADVVGVARSAQPLERVGDEVRAHGRDYLPISCDVADVDAIAGMAREAHDWSGGIDVLVNVAGIVGETTTPEITKDDWDAVFAVNVRGAYFASQEIGKRMLAGRGGAIVNVASIAGEVSTSPFVHYQASKAGLLHVTRSLAQLWSPKVRVNAVSPSFHPTEMNEAWLADPEVAGWITARTPMGRLGTTDEVAAAVFFLASAAAGYITGQNLRVDGGWTTL